MHGILHALFPPQPEAIADIVPGRQVLVCGTVVARDLLTSPVTAESCVYYNYAVEQWREQRTVGLPAGSWRLVEHDEAIAEFYLKDTSGRAIICPRRARIQRGRGIHTSRLSLGTSLRRGTELLICPGDVVEVRGIAEPADDLFDDSRDYRQRPRTIMIAAPDEAQLIIRLLDKSAPRAQVYTAGAG